jgi:hypothetical protein
VLAYCKNLSFYEYYMPCAIPEIKNVGWLDREDEFEIGTVEPDFWRN